jgi:hypothetical protein
MVVGVAPSSAHHHQPTMRAREGTTPPREGARPVTRRSKRGAAGGVPVPPAPPCRSATSRVASAAWTCGVLVGLVGEAPAVVGQGSGPIVAVRIGARVKLVRLRLSFGYGLPTHFGLTHSYSTAASAGVTRRVQCAGKENARTLYLH